MAVSVVYCDVLMSLDKAFCMKFKWGLNRTLSIYSQRDNFTVGAMDLIYFTECIIIFSNER